jgi:hypothetical protein
VSEPDRTPTHTVLLSQRLVAYVWSGPAGCLKRSGAANTAILCPIAFAEIRTFAASEENTLLAICRQAVDLDSLIFALNVAGYEVRTGMAKPAMTNRRF